MGVNATGVELCCGTRVGSGKAVAVGATVGVAVQKPLSKLGPSVGVAVAIVVSDCELVGVSSGDAGAGVFVAEAKTGEVGVAVTTTV